MEQPTNGTDAPHAESRWPLARYALTALLAIWSVAALAQAEIRVVERTNRATDGAASFAWSHHVGSGAGGRLLVAVSVRTVAPAEVASVTWSARGEQAARLRPMVGMDSDDGSVRMAIFELNDPAAGTEDGVGEIAVTLSAAAPAVGEALSFTGVRSSGGIRNQGCIGSLGAALDVSSDTISTDPGTAIVGFLTVVADAAPPSRGESAAGLLASSGSGRGHVFGTGGVFPGTGQPFRLKWQLRLPVPWIACYAQLKPAAAEGQTP
jgi:hypothetical protein